MIFSRRVPSDLAPNRFSLALARARAAGRPLLDLSCANPTKVGIRYDPALLAPLASVESLVYEPHPFGLPCARAAVARDFDRRGIAIDASRIVLTASTSEAYSILFKLLCDPGDCVLVPRPSYPLFEHLTTLDGVESAPYGLEYHGRWSVDLDSARDAITSRTRAILAVSPNNPTGSYLDDRDLAGLTALCEAHGLALIGDEVFAQYPLDAPAAQGFSPVNAGLKSCSSTPTSRWPSVVSVTGALCFGLGGLSKSVGLPQVKLGWIGVSGPVALVDAALARLEVVCDSYLSVATPVQQAAGALLAGGAAVRAQIAARIDGNYRALKRDVAHCPSCAVLCAEGGWYAVIQVPATGSEEDLVVALLEGDDVIVHPGYFFDFPREAFLVVSLLPAPDVFTAGIERVLARASGASR